MPRRSRLLLAIGLILAGALSALALPGAARAGASADPEARVELGRRLFFDPAVSRSGNNSCASCHDPEKAFSDPRRVSDDDFLATKRHSQTLVDAADRNAFHWDGEFDRVEELVTARLGVPSGLTRGGYGSPPPSQQPQPTVTLTDEAGTKHVADLRTMTPVAELVEKDGRYGSAFEAAFGSRRVTTARLAEAIGAFVRSIRHVASPYDRYAAGDRSALSDDQHRGLELFRGRAGCAACHRLSPSPAPFTDDQFHDTGVSRRTELRTARPPGTGADATSEGEDEGHGRLTGVARDRGAFKTPTLRDVALRGPYMHDGSFSTLEEVVRHYAKGGTPNPNLDPLVRPFKATDGELLDLVAFLSALSSGTRPAAAPEHAARARRTRLRILDAEGKPVADLPVRVVPEGDRLPGDGPLTSPERDLATDAGGFLEFVPPRRTHARLVLPEGIRLEQGEWVPDTCEKADLTATVRGRALVAVHFPAGAEPPKRLAAAFEETRAGGRDAPFALPWAAPASRAVFHLEGVVPVGGRPLARYAAWVRADAPKTATLEVPVAAALLRRAVSLEPGKESKLDLAE